MRRRICVFLFALIGLLVAGAPSGWCAGIKGDAEATSHGDEAASLQVVEQETLPEFIFRQYNLGVLSHYSYLIGSGGEAMIVDPARDIGRYLEDAERLGLKITRVYLTHSHADFVAGHIELTRATRAEILINKESGAEFSRKVVADGDEIRFGNVRALIRTTPGHTPDGTCLYVFHPAQSPHPKMVLTGDTLFIGSVGRPDLLEGAYSSARLAAMLFETWKEKLSKIPDETKLYPAHGAGSLCGAHLSDAPVSTFGEQKKTNPYLQHKDLSSFVTAVIDGLREPPQYFRHNAGMNRKGPDPVDWTRLMPSPLEPRQVREMGEKGAWLIDVRDTRKFAGGHAPNAVNIAIRGRYETWTGIMVPWGEPFILIGSDEEVAEASYRLRRIGYDKPAGYLKGGMAAWETAGLPQKTVALVKPRDLFKQMGDGTAPVIVDVRLPTEWMGLRIGNVLNFPIDRLSQEVGRLDPAMPVLMVCNSAYRSSMAAGIMQKLGFEDVRNLDGGGEAWIEAGLPTYGAEAARKVPTPGVFLALPERIDPETLANMIMDLPGAVDVVDIRPPWQFKEYHIPGALNVPVQELMSDPSFVNDKRPLVIVCRDGSISAAVGGALVQKSQRPIRFLTGGVMRYYDEIARPKGILSDRMPAAGPSLPGPALRAPDAGTLPTDKTPATPSAPQPTPPKKKSAGC